MGDVETCPACGGTMQPLLVREPGPPGPDVDGPLLADPPVMLACPACRDRDD